MTPKVALVIDDNSTNIQVIETLLETQGVRTIAVKNSEHVMATLATIAPPDVIFLDLEMPGLNGYDVLALMKADEHVVHIPIVAYTVHTSHFQDARAAGFHSFLAKPLDFNRFPGQLARILNGERVWESK